MCVRMWNLLQYVTQVIRVSADEVYHRRPPDSGKRRNSFLRTYGKAARWLYAGLGNQVYHSLARDMILTTSTNTRVPPLIWSRG